MIRVIKTKILNSLGFNSVLIVLNEIKTKLEVIERKADEVQWGLIFNNSISDSKWLLNKSFNPGRWAAGYPFLYILYRIFNDVKPSSVIEFGLGESSKIAYQYYATNPQVKYTIIEQDTNWINFFSSQIHDISSNVITCELETRNIEGCTVNSYKGLLKVLGPAKYNMIIVDGPFGSIQFSRYQVVDLAENNLIADDFIIIMDDYERLGEQQTVQKLLSIFNERSIDYVKGVYSGVKSTLIICSPQYKFLVSL